MRPVGVVLVVACAGALAGCDVPRPATPRLWTLFDAEAQYANGQQPTGVIATDAGLPGGIAFSSLLDKGQSTLTVLPTWAEGYDAAYVTTEVWAHFGPVWAQPMYVPITGFSDGAPVRVMDADDKWHPIFSVGPASRFYSPFWQTIYVLVPPTTQDGELTSTRQILDGHYPLLRSIGWVAALSPDGIHLAPDAVPPSGGATPGTGWLDGAAISFVAFPHAPFGVDDDLVVREVPIYHFVYQQDDGPVTAPAIPSVLGTGPPNSHTPPPLDAKGNLTAGYSAYWRVYTVKMPPGARVFDPFGRFNQALMDAGVPLATGYGADIMDTPAVNAFVGRVALDQSCFSSAMNIDPREGGTCVYLDSQRNIETLGPAAAVPTEITVTCPLVSLRGAAVGP